MSVAQLLRRPACESAIVRRDETTRPMTDEHLEKPLKPRPGGKPKRGGPRLDGVALLALAVGGALAVAGAWAAFVTDPLGGEPVATAAIERRAPARPASEIAAKEAAKEASTAAKPAGKKADDPAAQSRDGVPIVRPGDPMPKSGPVIIRVPGAEDAPERRPAASAGTGEVQNAMLEESRYGALPRIAADGRRPLDAYARSVQAAAGSPRVALVVAGLGVGREATLAALKVLPGEVTFAFSPYGADVADLVAQARKGGHEVLIQAPMEPFAYPSNDPGPQTLLTSLPASANLERLRWSLGRASGYVGIAPLAGGRFQQADEALAPVMVELARRGLLFVGQSGAESRVARAARAAGLPFGLVGAPIDASVDAAAIDAALGDLERDAKANGSAIGWASASPLTLKRIEAWRAGLAARGVALSPVTAALPPQDPS